MINNFRVISNFILTPACPCEDLKSPDGPSSTCILELQGHYLMGDLSDMLMAYA